MYYHMTRASDNTKTGAINVSTSSKTTCPDSCSFKVSGCYAKYNPLGLGGHWEKVSRGDRGTTFAGFLDAIECLPKGSFFRHNQAGDLPGENEAVNVDELTAMQKTIARRRLVAWTYTHKKTPEAVATIKGASIVGGMVVNLSADSLTQADALADTGLPICAVVPADWETKKAGRTPAGNLVVTCPAALAGRNTTCATCGNGRPLCAREERNYIIAFPAHGTAKKAVSKIAAVNVE